MSVVTAILDRVQHGDVNAAHELLPLVYSELRQLAATKMAQQPPGHTLQATALVHEAWLKLTGNAQHSWRDREHFIRAAAQAMRQILIDRARARARLKRGSKPVRVELEKLEVAAEAEPESLLLLDEALESLARTDREKAELVKLRFYVGLNFAETAELLGISEKTVKRRWTHARVWLYCEIKRLTGQGTKSVTL